MMKDGALTRIFELWRSHSPIAMEGNLSMHFKCRLWMYTL
uniref:Uncharacterized protein n=1 Tax=Rhizophora mucronata TaxID=61149 RepID=A0A2P2J9A2_RHIMU